MKNAFSGLLLIIAIFSFSPMSATEVPMPFHEDYLAEVLKVSKDKMRIVSVEVQIRDDANGKGRKLSLDKHSLGQLTRYHPIYEGDAFRIRISVLSDEKGNQTESIDIIGRALPNSGLAFHRYKNLKFGTTAYGIEGEVKYQYDGENGCYYIQPKAYPEALVMIDEKKIRRIDFNDWSRVLSGTPFESLASGKVAYKEWIKAQKDIEVWEHEYQEGYYLIWRSKDKKYGMVAEFTDNKITAFRAGLGSHVTFIEGCA